MTQVPQLLLPSYLSSLATLASLHETFKLLQIIVKLLQIIASFAFV